LFLAMMLAPFSHWRRTSMDTLLTDHWILLAGAPVLVLVITMLTGVAIEPVAIVIETIGLWILVLLGKNWFGMVRNVWRVPSASYVGMILGHAGIAIAALGVVVTTYYSEGRDVRMEPGDEINLSGYEFRFEKMAKVEGPNYVSDQGIFSVWRSQEEVARLYPEKRFYNVARDIMTEADLDPGLFRDLYVALGEPVGNGAWAVRLHVKPFVRWIWLGGLLVAVGGFMTLADRRYRGRRVPRNQVLGDVIA